MSAPLEIRPFAVGARRALATSALWCILLLVAWPSAGAQMVPGEPCLGDVQAGRSLLVQDPGTGAQNLFYGGGVRAECQGQNVTLIADSLEYYGATRTAFLIGNVRYVEPRVTMTATNVTYFMTEERVLAVGNVNARMSSGSSMTGPQAEYWRQTPARPRARMFAPGRPRFRLVERDAQGAPQPPVLITGNTVNMDGDSLVNAGGKVTIERPELVAQGDSMALDTGKETMRLMRGPHLRGTRGRPFTLSGRLIDVFSRQRRLERVLAQDSAIATSEGIRLESDTIDLRAKDDLLEHAYVWGRSRARVTSERQDIVADSLDVYMPFQRLREVRALRGARAEGMPDTTRFETDERDWLVGDTVITRFEPPRAGRERDSTVAPRLQEIVAIGAAAAFNQVPPIDTALRRPAINYVRGARITVTFDTGAVRMVRVEEQYGGIYLEPTADSTKRGADAAPAAGQRGSGASRGSGFPLPGVPAGGRTPFPIIAPPGGRRP